jgi:hypothetical protein
MSVISGRSPVIGSGSAAARAPECQAEQRAGWYACGFGQDEKQQQLPPEADYSGHFTSGIQGNTPPVCLMCSRMVSSRCRSTVSNTWARSHKPLQRLELLVGDAVLLFAAIERALHLVFGR